MGPPSELSKFISQNPKVGKSGDSEKLKTYNHTKGSHLILVPTQPKHHSMSLENDWIVQTNTLAIHASGCRIKLIFCPLHLSLRSEVLFAFSSDFQSIIS